MRVLVKQPGERLVERERFGAAVVDVEPIGVEPRGLVAPGDPLHALATVDGAVVQLAIGGGDDGERYLVTLRAELADGAVGEREIEVAVVESAWTLPDGGAPYLSIGDFVRAVGLDEVVRMTDAAGSGRIDRELLVGALTHAQAIVDAHLAGRYRLPLAVVPPIVAVALSDIARVRLYRDEPPKGIAEAGKAAARTLERIQGGQMPLDVATAGAEQPGAAPSAAPVLVSPGRRQYPDGLADY